MKTRFTLYAILLTLFFLTIPDNRFTSNAFASGPPSTPARMCKDANGNLRPCDGSALAATGYYYTPLTEFPELTTGTHKFSCNGTLFSRNFYASSYCAGYASADVGTEKHIQYTFDTADQSLYLANNSCGAAFWSCATAGAANTFSIVDGVLRWTVSDSTSNTWHTLAWVNDVTNYIVDVSKRIDLYVTIKFDDVGKTWNGADSFPEVRFGFGDADRSDGIFCEILRLADGTAVMVAITAREGNSNATTYFYSVATPLTLGVSHELLFSIDTDETFDFYVDDTLVATEATTGTRLSDYAAHTLQLTTSPNDWTAPTVFGAVYTGTTGTESTERIEIGKIRVRQP